MAVNSTWSNNRLTDRRSRGARLSPPCRSPADVRSPGCGYAHPERLLRGYPTVGGGFTNPSPVPIRLRGRPSLPSCLSLPVAFLWRSWRRESCCSCHPCLYQPWRPLQLSVVLLVPPDLRPPLRCLTSKRPLPQRELLDPQFLRCKILRKDSDPRPASGIDTPPWESGVRYEPPGAGTRSRAWDALSSGVSAQEPDNSGLRQRPIPRRSSERQPYSRLRHLRGPPSS